MSDKKLVLNRRRVLAGIGIIGAASAGAGAGTMALFSDTETSEENTVTAGTLDLTPDEGAISSFTISNVSPGDSGVESITLRNGGSLAGYLGVGIVLTDDDENGFLEAEPTDDTAESGELADLIDVEMGFGVEGTETIDSIVADASAAGFGSLTGVIYNANHELAPAGESGDSTDFVVSWSVPESVGNEIQGDSFAVDFEFRLTQKAMSTTHVLTADSPYIASGENPLMASSDAAIGEGSWQNDSGKHGRLYFGAEFSEFHSLPTFTVDEIEEISYRTKKAESFDENGEDFFLHIYTTTDSVSDPDTWYGRRLTALPAYAREMDTNAGEWTQWSTSTGSNQLQFYDMNRSNVSESVPLSTIQSGSVAWSSAADDYGPQTVKTLAIAADDTTFDSRLDAVQLTLTSGERLTLDLEA